MFFHSGILPIKKLIFIDNRNFEEKDLTTWTLCAILSLKSSIKKEIMAIYTGEILLSNVQHSTKI